MFNCAKGRMPGGGGCVINRPNLLNFAILCYKHIFGPNYGHMSVVTVKRL
jgi:hypothetical protein